MNAPLCLSQFHPAAIEKSRYHVSELPAPLPDCRILLLMKSDSNDGEEVCPAEEVLCDEEIRTWRSLHSERRRASWLLGRRCVKELVRRMISPDLCSSAVYRSIRIDVAESGAPFVLVRDPLRGSYRPLGCCISITHSHDRALVGVGPYDPSLTIGVDIERVEPRPRLFANTFFHTRECDRLEEYRGDARTIAETVLWSMKEAMLKATTDGLRRDTASFALTLSGTCGQKWREERLTHAKSSLDSVRLFHRRISDDFVITFALMQSSEIDEMHRMSNEESGQ